MSVLSDREIRQYLAAGLLGVEPLSDGDIQPASIDLHLHTEAKVMPYCGVSVIEQGSKEGWETVRLDNEIFEPGDLVLARTVEVVKLPPNIAGQTNGLSSLGRIGVMPFIGCSWIDPGFEGFITLEIVSLGGRMRLQGGMRITQLTFHELTSPALRPYGTVGLGSKYQNQKEMLSIADQGAQC